MSKENKFIQGRSQKEFSGTNIESTEEKLTNKDKKIFRKSKVDLSKNSKLVFKDQIETQ